MFIIYIYYELIVRLLFLILILILRGNRFRQCVRFLIKNQECHVIRNGRLVISCVLRVFTKELSRIKIVGVVLF